MMFCRLLADSAQDGPHNMAADEVLLQAAVGGVASLRFYHWSEATLSLGYFQEEAVRRQTPQLASLPFVRRLSGGAALVHHHELTYALAVPAGQAWQNGESWLCRMHRLLAAALGQCGVRVDSCGKPSAEQPFDPLCFHQLTAGDLLLGGHKIVGSAQRRRKGALLQHGAILLSASPCTPTLPGIAELTGRLLTFDPLRAAIGTAFQRDTGCILEAAEWSDDELRQISQLADARYRSAGWNCKR